MGNILINVLLVLLLTVGLFIGIDLRSFFPTPPVDSECLNNVNEFLINSHQIGCLEQEIDLVGNYTCAIKAYGIQTNDPSGVEAALDEFYETFCAYMTSFIQENRTTDGIISARNLFKAAMYDLIDILTFGNLEDFLASDEAKPYNARVTGWEAFTTNAAQNTTTARQEISGHPRGEMMPRLLEGISAYNMKHILRINLEISV